MKNKTEKFSVNKAPSYCLWYTRPADDWCKALPVGNGRLGGMIFGKPDEELIQLNEDSIWSGNYRNRNNPKAYDNLEKMRRLINEGKPAEAEALCADAFYGTNENQRHYQPLGDLHIFQNISGYENYEMGLDLSCGLQSMYFTANGVRYCREIISSCPDEVIVIRFTADKAGSISFTAFIDGRDDNYDKNEAYDNNTILFTVSDGIPYACAITLRAKGGVWGTDANRLSCKNADSALLIIAAQTLWRTGDYVNMAVGQANTAARKGWEELCRRHFEDYKSLYDRCSLNLSPDSDVSGMTTDSRLEAVKNGSTDNELCTLYFNFSRYLMIAGSRQGTLPLNLQGIWNKDMWPAWGCKFTININTEMNYWGAEICALPECHMPLFDHIERMREHGRVTAREMYHCRGAVCHHNTDIWGDTAPQDKWLPATLWPMGFAWLCTHIWEHYAFTLEREFLAEKFDTMLEAAEFFLDYLVEDDDGCLVTSPSVSPENTYYTAGGEKGTLCKAPSMDSQILYTLFTDVIKAADIIGQEINYPKETVEEIKAARERLPKPRVGKYGQIMEWAEDYDETEPGHRHISQLYALYPADMITVSGTPELAAAARATLERRLSHGGGHTGWSRAWIINMWARLGDGEQTEKNINALLAYSTSENMFDMHPPFQIDGNFGGGAGIAEALLQSAGGEITLLPALPPHWQKGEVKDFKARGGITVSFAWEKGRVTKAELTAKEDITVRVRCQGLTAAEGAEKADFENGAMNLKLIKGKKCSLIFQGVI